MKDLTAQYAFLLLFFKQMYFSLHNQNRLAALKLVN